jgi:hypothetical protein
MITNLCDFRQFAVFSKANVMIIFLQKIASVSAKNAIFSAKIFLKSLTVPVAVARRDTKIVFRVNRPFVALGKHRSTSFAEVGLSASQVSLIDSITINCISLPFPGLPDFSWYMIPKPENVPNEHKCTKWL